MKLSFQRLQSLAERVADGEVVFFVGAGFSIDSEENTAERLVGRLVVRFEALTALLRAGQYSLNSIKAGREFDSVENIQRIATDLRRTLFSTFHLEEFASPNRSGSGDEPWDATALLRDNLAKLRDNYYSLNEWMTSAFQTLLRALNTLENPGEFLSKLAVWEAALIDNPIFEVTSPMLRQFRAEMPVPLLLAFSKFYSQLIVGDEQWRAAVAATLDKSSEELHEMWGQHGEKITNGARRKAIGGLHAMTLDEVKWWSSLGELGGKAMFLDTMGFANPDVMCGMPGVLCVDAVAKSYKNKLLPRHHVLARLAREGCCPTLLTTNYDLLIEGGYRLAGFGLARPGETSWRARSDRRSAEQNEEVLPSLRAYQRFVRVADAVEFFEHCVNHDTAQIFKIHGCVDLYREKRKEIVSWKNYLPAMVFTYREVQNWRGDSWSRDLLSTLLRTRTIAFLGYSASDPVIHDTFRTVYEEMAERREASTSGFARGAFKGAGYGSEKKPLEGDAPAYFFGIANRREFHGLEILRAATAAIGGKARDLTDHPNYIDFFRRGGNAKGFPNLDDSLLWLYHCTIRNLQCKALEIDLRRAGALLFGHPCNSAEVEAIRANFDALCREEQECARGWSDEDACIAQFQRIISWTDCFHANLLREMAVGEIIQRDARPHFALSKLRRQPWYFPVAARRDWAAWGVVIELALRRMIAMWRRQNEAWAKDSSWVRPATWNRVAGVVFSEGQPRPAPVFLNIGVTLFGRGPVTPDMPGIRTCLMWDLHPQRLPWRTDPPEKIEEEKAEEVPPVRTRTIPTARQLWNWAHGLNPSLCSAEKLESFFGSRPSRS